ncbi:uncharacterized protein KIAA1522 homolog isoform X2 [Mugil cephalus]|uniref:uncharacterized protein KIAA1522 homolog isoform X2 n=1 Tax=Mugil cephalus TaxID=48193 RepID=UPI001FB56F6A|nr:uncharacterized protein KIAA1522 homolog isoform X2 [Mugil cephalus]
MSRRRSTGDLVPRDITEILAREVRAQRGQRKPGSSFGQAFSWLKGSRRKKNVGNGLNRNSVTDAKPGIQNHDPVKAGPKGNEEQKRLTVHYTASQHYQENVFIEGSRPQYLEDLHTEAQEGLKILQQEEHKNGVNFADDESIASTDTLRPEQDISSKDGDDSPESRSTFGNTDPTVTSAVLTRPALTRQGSTFKPLNPVKRLEKSRKRSRRTTIMGIPNQVQKELALHRISTFQPLVPTLHLNPDRQDSNSQSGVVIIPTVDGGTPIANKEGARVHLSELEAFRDEHLVREHLQGVYQDEQSFSRFGSHLCPTANLRPKSLAVPGITTSSSFSPSMFNFLQEPQGPVMSISPQATYLSTIIPNAVLPASIEVIEIERSNTRSRGSTNHGSSILTVSKSSLTSGESSISPLLSRRSDGDSSQTSNSQNNCLLMPISASGANWSELQSSKIIISDSSPVSSKDSTRSGNSQRVGFNIQENQAEQSGGDSDLVSLQNSVISSLSSKSENHVTGQGSVSSASESVDAGEHAKNQRNKRSLSVMKTKQPPAPPRRTNSLHGNKIRGNSRVIVDNKDLHKLQSGEVTLATENIVTENGRSTSKILTPASNSVPISSDSFSSSLSPASNEAGGATQSPPEACTSSPRKISSEGEKFERTLSPSSGYSSQSGTPTLSPKGMSPTSPEKLKKKPVKPERSVSRASSSAASPSSSLTSLSSGISEIVNPDISSCSPNLPLQGPLPTVATKELTPNSNPSFRQEVKELLNIPPPPKVKAPCPPPPETWAHNGYTFELLCGPRTVSKVVHKPAQIRENTGNLAEIQTERKDTQVLEEHQKTAENSVLTLSENETMTEALTTIHPEAVHVPHEVRKCPATQEIRPSIQDKGNESVEVHLQEQSSSYVLRDPESEVTTPKKDPPPVMKKPISVLHREETVLTEQSQRAQQKEMSTSAARDDHLPVENHALSQNGVTVLVDNSENGMDKSKVPSVQTLTMDAPKMNKVSPPPTPPPAYQPTPPLSRKSPPSSVSMPPKELHRVQEEIQVVESSWPPPPPPLEGDSVFDGGDEVDFPPPPPPIITHSVPDVDLPPGNTVENPDFPSAISQPVTTDNKPVAVVSKDNTGDEICHLVQNIPSVSDNVSTPELPLLLPITSAESTVSTITGVPDSIFLKRSSLKTDDQSLSVLPVSAQASVQTTLPAENVGHGVSFRRQPSVAGRDARSKEILSRQKSAPIPKEDANIPLVTPSLLQMVRLRSVNMTEDQVKTPPEDKSTNDITPVQENGPVSTQGPQNIPQKPIRKSLSLKSSPQTVKTSSVTLNPPSLRLQEAIRMKTAAMSLRDGVPSRLGVIPPMYSYVNEPGALSLKSPEGCDMYKSPASTASFIFSRSTKKVIIETAATSSPEAQSSLKQNLAAELMKVSDQSKVAASSNGGLKCDKVPPPVAKKPTPGSVSPSQNFPSCPEKMENNGNGMLETQYMSGITPPESTTIKVTADTIETLF